MVEDDVILYCFFIVADEGKTFVYRVTLYSVRKEADLPFFDFRTVKVAVIALADFKGRIIIDVRIDRMEIDIEACFDQNEILFSVLIQFI